MIGISEELTVIRPGGALSPRCAGVLEAALAGRQAEVLSRLEGPLTGRRLLFVVSLDEGGVNRGFYDLLAHLRTHPNCLDRCVGSVLVDAPGDLYTKAAGRDLVLAANLAGCAFVGRPLVEGTGDLRNFTVQARNAGCSLEAAYHLATADLVERVLAFSRPRLERPKLLALHASSRATSNTLALWGLVRTRLEERCDITEICLRNGTLETKAAENAPAQDTQSSEVTEDIPEQETVQNRMTSENAAEDSTDQNNSSDTPGRFRFTNETAHTADGAVITPLPRISSFSAGILKG